MSDDPRRYVSRKPGRWFTASWIAAVLVVCAATAAIVLARDLRLRRQGEIKRDEAAKGRRVLVTRPSTAPATRALEVPASVRGFEESLVYAKIAGYLKRIAVDKGDHVTAGQVIAELESPEVDQQVANAEAAVTLQRATDARTQALVREGVVAKQTGDETRGALAQAEATLAQLRATQAYEQIRAPFTGVVTARAVDPGALVSQATAGAGTPIVTVASLARMRVSANLPQSAAVRVQVGDPAGITVKEYPGRVFAGTVSRRAEALRTATRTMLVEVDVPNEDGALYPGMYATARFDVTQPEGPPTVPDDALVFRGGRVYVPLVRDGHLVLAAVELGYDDGRTVEITSGISADDTIAMNVGQAARDGEPVHAVPLPQR
ncbi:MAG: efflux RND transporter periplasmic adaptor subunit [Deltaproteobacteria bacterium]|nr:efflux RND transporter periplasmic adaptor subunit [Deltaproteobacteria bacterium]